MLKLPDYRSAERTFQLLTQVAGRAGRADAPGEVFLQTYDPENYAVEAASRQDYRAFFEEEMRRRRRALYPPYTLIARLLFESDSETGRPAGRRGRHAADGSVFRAADVPQKICGRAAGDGLPDSENQGQKPLAGDAARSSISRSARRPWAR